MPLRKNESDFEELLEILTESNKGITTLCRENNIFRREFNEWCIGEGRERYARARELQLQYWSERVFEIAENCESDLVEIQKAKLLIDSIKWILSKLRPDVYGNNSTTKVEGENGIKIEITRHTTQANSGGIVNENE